MEGNIFTELSILLVLAALVSLVMRMLRQPLIIGYIFTGVIVGPALFGLIQFNTTIEAFSSFGIALLLFIVGLGLNPRVIKEVGRASLYTGIGQVLFTALVGFGLIRLLGWSPIMALYIAIALTFSSTIIILKLLTDKKHQNKLYGKISIGFLLVQDVIAAIALVVASSASAGGFGYSELGGLAIKGAVLGAGVFYLSNRVVRPMTAFLSSSQELLFLFAIAWGFGIGALFFQAGFSLEIGALIAGIALSTMTYAQEVSAKLRPLRDFFIVIFFIALGANLDFMEVGATLDHALILSLFVLVGNPIIVMIIMGLLGYTKKTSFNAGLTVAQISEFSLIFILVGHRNGQVSDAAVSLVTMVGIITIAASTYMIIYADKLYEFFEKYLTLFERRKVHPDHEGKHYSYDLVLFGYRKGGHEFLRVFKHLKKPFVVIDYDPEVIDTLDRQNIDYLYGDMADQELLREIGIEKSKLIVSTISDHPANIALIKLLEKENPHAVVICHAENVAQAEELYNFGASYVMMPHYIGSEHIGSFIKRSGLKKNEFKKYREKHLKYLQEHFAAFASSN